MAITIKALEFPSLAAIRTEIDAGRPGNRPTLSARGLSGSTGQLALRSTKSL